MEFSMFGKNLKFGAVKGYSLSHLGIAIRNSAGNMVSYDKNKNEIVDVDLIDFKGDNLVYALPVAISEINVGDIVLHNDVPMFVVGKGTNSVPVVDVKDGEKKEILPTKSMFGFDFITKLVTLVDFSANKASQSQPFGNLLPLMLMANGGNEGKMQNMLPLMFLMNQNNNNDFKFDMSNPLLLMAMMGGSESNNFFPMMLMMQQMQTPPAAKETSAPKEVNLPKEQTMI